MKKIRMMMFKKPHLDEKIKLNGHVYKVVRVVVDIQRWHVEAELVR